MLNLEPRLDQRLWAAIVSAYQSGNYTGAILDSIHFLGELIREKTGLEGDGVALVGQAFGGQNPKLKVTKLQTESDRNIQQGVEQILRGLYQGIRNPRSHQKYVDSVEDAEALILFTNYLVTVIDKAKGPFDKGAFLQQVFDPYFTEDGRYADLLIERIPRGKRWDVLVEVYRRKKDGKGQKLSYFFHALLRTLQEKEIDQFCEIVSQELETTTEDAVIRAVLQSLPSEHWSKYSELARIRTEGKLIDAVKDGRYDRPTGKCMSGGLGTWSIRVLPKFVLKEKLMAVLAGKLDSSDASEHDYVFECLLPTVADGCPNPSSALVSKLRKGLKAGDTRFRDALFFLTWSEPTDPWVVALKADFDAFVEAQDFHQTVTDDDVPF